MNSAQSDSRLLPVLERICSDPMCARNGTYSVRGCCTNCGSEYELVLTKGHAKPGGWSGAKCPACGCKCVAGHELIGDNDDA